MTLSTSASICRRRYISVRLTQRLQVRAVDIGTTILLLGDPRELGYGEFRAKPVVAAEAHDDRFPQVRVDPVWPAFHQERRGDVDALDPHFQRNDALEGALGTTPVLGVVVPVRHHRIDAHEFGLELDGT